MRKLIIKLLSYLQSKIERKQYELDLKLQKEIMDCIDRIANNNV